ncbi:hypothetical protein [Roseofilum sp. Guam]|uniref:hypothetical protein n=1 Tax=Roseofilum sp. Guam TaxID=2821502 RepID=UPI001B1900F7|nr:hypothetical protein [Roseofilum sp. Guam]MBP0029828.1 hypothetical protein [Roseofilum sp. Guam]
MKSHVQLKGVIEKIHDNGFLHQPLEYVNFQDFDINNAKGFGVIQLDTSQVSYSKWVSPKRTRSYPFARIYNTYDGSNVSNISKIVTIIPVIKDEGKDGDRDRIQFSTISWMNLLNIYIVLAYYDTAQKNLSKNQVDKHKLTQQCFNNKFVKSQIKEIFQCKETACEWNNKLLKEKFTDILNQALDCYDLISKNTGVLIHSRESMDRDIQKFNDQIEEFRNASLRGSYNASNREAKTIHELEYLVDGVKAQLQIKDYLGGTYYLTCDEFYNTGDMYVLQESKNSSKDALPKISDIQDGLFKLILFQNLQNLNLDGQHIDYCVKLKLTGKGVRDSILLPDEESKMNNFFSKNIVVFNDTHQKIIKGLLQESMYNKKLKIEISCG